MTGHYEFHGYANDTLLAFDNRGRILRIYCEDLPYTNQTDMGIYIARYAGLSEADDYRITWLGRLDGSKLTLLYKDGTIGFVDTEEWVNNHRRVKVLEKGISIKSAPTLGEVLNYVPEMLFVTDTSGKVGWTYLSTVKQKDRTARTRVFTLKEGDVLDSYYATDAVTGALVFTNPGKYRGKLVPFVESEFLGNYEDFVSM